MATTRASPVLDRPPAGEPWRSPVGVDHAGRAQGVEQRLERPAGGQPWVERGDGVAGVPDRRQGVDEARPTRQVQGDELGHGR